MEEFGKQGEGTLLVRWTTDWDCGYETEWWYIIRESPFDIETLSKNSRKHIRQAMQKCYVKKINTVDYIDALYYCYEKTVDNYKNFQGKISFEGFSKMYLNCESSGVDCWGCFSIESNDLIGYITVVPYDDYAETQTAKFLPEYLNLRTSDAIYYTVFEYYLNQQGKKYVCSGTRNISHITNTQDYKIKTFNCRKAYCKLHIRYKPKISCVIKLLYPFRKILSLFDSISKIHQINAVIKMEEIIRRQRKRETL